MVISGANAGGKTVVLKTTGLLALMALSGISVPAQSARFPFYASVLGGHRRSSIAGRKSFDVYFTRRQHRSDDRRVRSAALVLLDEVGTGTDPEEGSALGVAVVDHFRRACGAHVIATTHYSGLKMYAGNEEGVINASVEFDEKTLRPTYRLVVGVAGASSGLEIARRFGVPLGIVENAMRSVKESSLQASEYLRRIKREAEDAEALRLALEEERRRSLRNSPRSTKRLRNKSANGKRRSSKLFSARWLRLKKRAQELVARIEDRTERVRWNARRNGRWPR